MLHLCASGGVACEEAGWQFDSRVHPGAHHFPENWEAMRPEVAAFLTE